MEFQMENKLLKKQKRFTVTDSIVIHQFGRWWEMIKYSEKKKKKFDCFLINVGDFVQL